MTAIPTIETERLILRPWRHSDFAPVAAFYADDPSSRFVSGPRDPAHAEMWFLARFGDWALRGFGTLAFEEKASGRWIGWCGINQYVTWPEPGVQYALTASARGHGYMVEGARPTLDYMFRASGRDRFETTIHPTNAASKAVARKLGARPTERMEMDDGQLCEVWIFSPSRGGA